MQEMKELDLILREILETSKTKKAHCHRLREKVEMLSLVQMNPALALMLERENRLQPLDLKGITSCRLLRETLIQPLPMVVVL